MVSIRHGPIIEAPHLRTGPWVPQAESVVAIGGMTFVCINKMDGKLRTLVGGKATKVARWSGVVDTMQQCRTNAQLKWMKMKSRADDPMYDTSAETTEITQAEIRSALVDIPQYLEISIPATGKCDAHTMNVLTAASAREKVWFELSEDNIKWMTQAYATDVYRPKPRNAPNRNANLRAIRHEVPDVKWCDSKKMLWAKYTDTAGKTRHVSKSISESSDEEYVEKVRREASRLQQARDESHAAAQPAAADGDGDDSASEPCSSISGSDVPSAAAGGARATTPSPGRVSVKAETWRMSPSFRDHGPHPPCAADGIHSLGWSNTVIDVDAESDYD